MGVMPEDLRTAALAAFSHEVRTPLTALRMIVDLATPTTGGGRELDRELTELLGRSLAELEALVNALHEHSRAERGLLVLEQTPARLADVLAGVAADAAAQDVVVTFEGAADAAGDWDAARLRRALAELVVGANRLGDQSGRVHALVRRATASTELMISSGGGEADTSSNYLSAPFAFFWALAMIRAMGGQVSVTTGGSFCRCGVSLPS